MVIEGVDRVEWVVEERERKELRWTLKTLAARRMGWEVVVMERWSCSDLLGGNRGSRTERCCHSDTCKACRQCVLVQEELPKGDYGGGERNGAMGTLATSD